MLKKKTAKTLKKTPPIITAPLARDLDAESQLQLELYWCVQQLEILILNAKVGSKRDELIKNLKTLKSNTAPEIKKRQMMKATFGDYRSKMKEEEKKLALAARQIKFTAGDGQNKSSFVKKAAILTSGKDFKFNFNPETSVVDTPAANSEENCENKSLSSTVNIANNLNFSSEGGFKFNFAIENDEEIGLDKLSIKS